MLAALGTDSDRNVASTLGISHGAVKQMRHKLGIPPAGKSGNPHGGSHWAREDLALLGTATDREVADALGRPIHTVFYKRRSMGIPAFTPAPVPIDWTEEMIASLGTATDSEIGNRLGISASSIKNKRGELGIAAFIDKRPVISDDELIELLHQPSTEVRRRTGLKWETIKKLRDEHGIEPATYADLRWTPEILARLGTEPDARIAEDLGISAAGVGGKRRKLGIPSFRSSRRWEDHEIALLGTAPDEDIAAQLGRSVNAVRIRRRKLERDA